MISKQRALDMLCTISSLSADELEQYDTLLDKNISILADGAERCSAGEESRYEYYIAARTNYEIALIRGAESSVSSFKAGDVTISESGDHSLAREIYMSALADVRDIVGDDAFAFIQV